MLYLIESGNCAKICATRNWKTFEREFKTYQTCNPNFRILDTASGDSLIAEKLRRKYKKYIIGKWCYAKRLVIDIWLEYRDLIKTVDYYTKFRPINIELAGYESVKLDHEDFDNLIEAHENNLMESKHIDMYKEFEQFYDKKEQQEEEKILKLQL